MENAIGNCSHKPLEAKSVLLIESNTILFSELNRILSDVGADVIGPVTPETFLDQLKTYPNLDGALLEFNLSSPQTWKLADALSKSGVPILLYAAHLAQHAGIRLLYPIIGQDASADELIAKLSGLLRVSNNHLPAYSVGGNDSFDEALQLVKKAMDDKAR